MILSKLAALLLLIAAQPCLADDKPDSPGKREVHVVGVYEGFTKSDGKIHGGKALVSVNRPGKLVTVVFASYDPVTWEVTASANTQIERVILGGFKRSAVKGLPEKTPVVEAFAGSNRPALPYAYQLESPAFRAIVETVDAMTGLKVASFNGRYRAEAEHPFVVDSVQDDERFSADWPRPADPASVPKLTFAAHHFVAGARSREVTRSYGDYTLTGPVADALKPLPDRVQRIAYDPAGKKYYAIADHGLAAVDMAKRTLTKIEAGLDVPEISWPAAITFDTKRDRVLMTAGGYLYAYYPKTAKWEALTEKLDAPALVYHAKDDALYSLKGDGGGELRRLNQNGAVISSIKLDGPIPPGVLRVGPGVTGLQLVPADDKLVLLVVPGDPMFEKPVTNWSYIYLIDQKSGKATLTWKSK